MAPRQPATRLRQLLVDLEPPEQGQLIATAAVGHALHEMYAQWKEWDGRAGKALFDYTVACMGSVDTADHRQMRMAPLPARQNHMLLCSCNCNTVFQAAASRQYLSQAAENLNPDQLEAIRRVLQMRDYMLLLGMPGTGKTTTIVHIIKALLAAGCSILITSYTNSAVDNILIKLAEDHEALGNATPNDTPRQPDTMFLRLGSASAVHHLVRPYLPGGERHPVASAACIAQLASSARVVGTTCLSARHALLARRTFDVVIVDEASQISLPSVLGPLLRARSFLLVGDHYQLAPLVTSQQAQDGGLGISLFRQLSEAAPQAVVTLRRQYRMSYDIMSLANTLVYSGGMQCGSDAVARAMMALPRRPANVAGKSDMPSWLCQVSALPLPCFAIVSALLSTRTFRG
eukprot:366426-Chlamydomonas_euryale.AAC.24